MLKILHTADVHIGAKLAWLGTKSDVQRNRILGTFEKVVNIALEKKVDVLLVAGDLFDSYNPDTIGVAYVKNLFEKLALNHIYTIVIPGNHDRLEPASVYFDNSIKSNQYTRYVNTPGTGVIPLPELGLDVYVYGISKQFGSDRPLAEVSKLFEQTNTRAKHSIALLHGSLELANKNRTNYPISSEEIANSHFDYIALGDWHSLLDVSSTVRAFYSGSPELVGRAQTECGNVLLVQIDDAKTEVTPVKVGQTFEQTFKFLLDKYEGDINQQLIKEVTRIQDINMVLTLELEGYHSVFENFKPDSIIDLIADKFFFVDIKDNTQLRITEKDLEKYPESSLVGRYIKLVRTEMENTTQVDERQILEKALYEGVNRIINSKHD